MLLFGNDRRLMECSRRSLSQQSATVTEWNMNADSHFVNGYAVLLSRLNFNSRKGQFMNRPRLTTITIAALGVGVASVGEYEHKKGFSQSHGQRIGNGCGGCSSTAGRVSSGEYR